MYVCVIRQIGVWNTTISKVIFIKNRFGCIQIAGYVDVG
jgi:hypothetical protein